MNKRHLQGVVLGAAASLFAFAAYAQNPSTPPGKANNPGNTPAAKVEKAADKAADKAEKTADKLGDKADKTADRASRKAKEHDALRDKLKANLKAPMNEALKQELRRHAERVARLERIKSVADTEKDKASGEKASTLLTKENERHEKWMTMHATSAPATNTGTTPPTTGATPAPTTGSQGGTK